MKKRLLTMLLVSVMAVSTLTGCDIVIDAKASNSDAQVVEGVVENNVDISNLNTELAALKAEIVEIVSYNDTMEICYFYDKDGNEYVCNGREMIDAVRLASKFNEICMVYEQVGEQRVVSYYSCVGNRGESLGMLTENEVLDYYNIPSPGEKLEDDITITGYVMQVKSPDECYYNFTASTSDGVNMEFYYYTDDEFLWMTFEQGKVLNVEYEVVEGDEYSRDKRDVKCNIISFE